ncbi:hypothetical protein HYALB_00002894 [Hymenoscyphus albidus]|uniref:Uncharacterized protein n=1 Tax=Hymenoscyphus albidus TaxID=595503 RepID=A0A9N9LZV3_9HELO|nr:hypothetical protein HYALB_00002894 [Hymenoscyphus albidus]
MLPKPDISINPNPMEALVASIQANLRLPQGLSSLESPGIQRHHDSDKDGENSSSTKPFECSSFANYTVLGFGSKPLSGIDASRDISGVRAEEVSEDGRPMAMPLPSNPISSVNAEKRAISGQELDPTDSGEVFGQRKTKASTSTSQNKSTTTSGATDDTTKSEHGSQQECVLKTLTPPGSKKNQPILDSGPRDG